jgi:uncharacterized protein (TIGR02246 family)
MICDERNVINVDCDDNRLSIRFASTYRHLRMSRSVDRHHLGEKSMKTSNPLDAVNNFVSAMNKGDLETALGLYEPGAAFVVQPGVVATGLAAVREALAGMLSLKPTLTTEAYQVVEAGDVALYCSRWRMSGTDPAGNTIQNQGRSSDILRRQTDGNWRIALDNPYGPDIVAWSPQGMGLHHVDDEMQT